MLPQAWLLMPANAGERDSDPFAEEEARKKTVDALFTDDLTGINFDAYEDIPVEATGRDVPDAISSFDEVSFTHLTKSESTIRVCN